MPTIASIFDSPPPAAGASQLARLRVFGGEAETTASLTVTTADGDRVTISADATARVGYASLGGTARGPGQAAAEGQALDVELAGEVRVDVQGDLDARERADVDALLRGLAKAVADGDPRGLAAVLHDAKLGSLARVGLTMEEHARVSAADVSARSAPGLIQGLVDALRQAAERLRRAPDAQHRVHRADPRRAASPLDLERLAGRLEGDPLDGSLLRA